MSDKITCRICNAEVHSIQIHLRKDHPEMSISEYSELYPEAPLLSDVAQAALDSKRSAAEASSSEAVPASVITKGLVKKSLHETFKLGRVKAALSGKGEPIPITVLSEGGPDSDLIPEKSDDYVYDVDELKNVILALELNIPCYVWGHKGSGKTELYEQIAARTNRPFMRVQHTLNTEESHIVGQWTVKDGHTVFELGPLPLAMRNGWMYCADEYDFGMPSVLSVYQAILEGKSLVIKEAPVELRIIKPHPDFRFVATGNTNGNGDETGLYQGTSLQNSANYDRFGMVIHKQYMKKQAESKILQNRVGLVQEDADKMVEYAALIREAYDGAKISDVISPRTLIYAAKIGVKRGSFRQGVTLSFINKLTKVDREVCDGLAQRIFG
ncbi:MoxR family ATPase [Ferrovum sp.]|uniref:AAA family ATPase n=1 Tax=Ferrovum sp. TaxID=2609467 RepID=UPI0026030EC3|nr:MoxR family ATPase [Ferrovum sp.]